MSLVAYSSPFTTDKNNSKTRYSTISNVQTLVDEQTTLINLDKDSNEQKEKNKLVLSFSTKPEKLKLL